MRVIGVTDEELAHPYTPHGINTYLNLFGSGKGIPLSAPQHTFDFLGVPILAPNYSFGVAHYVPHKTDPDYAALVQQIRRDFRDPAKAFSAPPASSNGLKTIASVQAISRDYVMRLVGMEIVRGHDDYYLALEPVRDPKRYRLRQLWVDSTTFALDRVTTQGNFVFGGATDVTWTTDFDDVDGTPYIECEHTDQAFSDYRHKYDSASVIFTNVVPTTIPPYASISDFRVNGETGVPPLIEPL